MKQRRTAWVSAFVAAVILLSMAGPWSLADTPPAQPDGPVVIKLYVRDRAHLDQVAGELDIWEVHYDQGHAVAAVSPAQYQWLESLGYRIEIDAERTARMSIQAPLDPRFHYYDDYYTNPNGLYIVNFLQETNIDYDELTELFDIGDAWLADVPGEHDRDILVLRITNEDAAFGAIEDKPAFYLFANIHAREVATPELAIRYIKYLTGGYNGEGGYGVDPDVTWLVDHNVVYVQVMQNPDGHWVNEQNTSAYRRKNMDNDDGCTDPSSWGVDLNRNHSFFWGCCGGSSGSPCSETYRGPSRGSEPETQAFQNFFNLVMKDQNGPNGDDEYPPAAPITTTGIFISLHQYSDLVLWPWDLPVPPPNEPGMETIGRKLAYYNTYVPGSIGYTVDGSTDDWTYGKFGIPSYTFEVGSSGGTCGGFFPSYDCLDGTAGAPRSFWAENKPAFLWAHKIARTPYMTAYGPDTETVVVSPDVVRQGTPVTLTATIADHRYGSDPLQPIYGAEYFFDAPGEDGTGMAMTSSDGSWGDLTEDVEAVVDTSSLLPGRHYILVHGLNDDGDWGPFTAVFITTTVSTNPEAIDLEASPESIPIVQGQATVTATLTLSDGTPTPGWVVTFTTDLGTLVPETAMTDGEGHALTTLYAADTAGTAHLSAEGAGLTATPVNVEFYVPEAPVAGFSDSSPVCVGSPVSFTNTTTSPPMAPAEYLWDFGDGTGISTETHPVYTYSTGGDFSVSLTASNPGGSDEVTHTVTITPTPTAFFTYTPAYPQPGEQIQFYDASNGNPMAWDWDFGDEMGKSSLQNPAYTYLTTGTFTVTLRAENSCGWGTEYSRGIRIGEEPPQFQVYLPIIIRNQE
jgi:PKD repeat protein